MCPINSSAVTTPLPAQQSWTAREPPGPDRKTEVSQAGCVNGRGPARPKEATGWPTAPRGPTMTLLSSFPGPVRRWTNSSVFM